MIELRADVVGSLLRPPYLLEARRRLEEGELASAELKRVEDRAVDEAVLLKEEAGLEVVTDGEMRRLSFQSRMTEVVEGFGSIGLEAFLWGEWRGDGWVGDSATPRPEGLGVTRKLRRRRSLSAEEFTYLRAHTTRVPKVSLPSPSLFANFWSPTRSVDSYPTLEGFLADVVDILRGEVAELASLGATYIQLDAPHYALLIDPRTRAFYESRGWDLDQWLERGIEMDNAVIAGAPDVTFGFHVCRGNQESRWLCEGGYEPIARRIFRRVAAGRLLLEYDDERSGSFEALREVPADKTVVLGLVTTKSPRLETVEGLIARIREAARYVALERLAVSPQCGFASSIRGNRITPEDQERKLRLVVETAGAVWG